MFRKNNYKIISKVLVFLMIITSVISYVPSSVNGTMLLAEAGELIYNENDLALEAVRNIYDFYKEGTPIDGSYGNFNSYNVYILKEAGVDVSLWERDETNMRDEALALIDNTIANEGTNEASSAKRIAQDYLAAVSFGEDIKTQALLQLLVDRQNESGGFDGNVYSDFPALDLISRVDNLTGSGINVNKAVEYILNNQDSSGGFDKNWQDFMTTAEAVRILKTAEKDTSITPAAITLAIDNGLSWLQEKQQDDGGYVTGFDSKTTDTSEMIYTALVLKRDPKNWIKNGKNPFDYMIDYAYKNGSFGDIQNTAWALDAYLQLGASIPEDKLIGLRIIPTSTSINKGETISFIGEVIKAKEGIEEITQFASWTTSDESIATIDEEGVLTAKNSGTVKITATYEELSSSMEVTINKNSSGESTSSKYRVNIAVLDDKGNLMYGPKKVYISEDDEYEGTAMDALNATGLDWSFSDDFEGMVTEIEGLKNSGMDGWMYSVNGEVPKGLPIDKDVRSGDKVLFWYSTSAMEGSPKWPDKNSSLGNQEEIQDDNFKKTLEVYIDNFKDGKVLNTKDIMAKRDAESLFKTLEKNRVSLSERYQGKELLVSDDEVSILIPEDALDERLSITSNELEEKETPKQYGIRLASSVYEFGPKGTKFDKPITISIKIPIYEEMDLKKFKPAWFDEETNKWVTLAYMLDAKNGIVIFQVDHFSRFAVVETENRVKFKDVTEDIDWAKDAIEILAGNGIINGTEKGFEPNRYITRAEFIKLIVEAYEYKKSEPSGNIFKDVAEEDWFSKYVEIGFENHIIKGDIDGNFRPQDEINRSEIAVILSRLGEEEEINDFDLIFKDAQDIPKWAIPGVSFVAKENIMKGYEDNEFKGERPTSRAEAAVVLYRHLNFSIN